MLGALSRHRRWGANIPGRREVNKRVGKTQSNALASVNESLFQEPIAQEKTVIAERFKVGANRLNEPVALGSQGEANDAHNWQSQFQGEPPGWEVVKNDFGAEVQGDGDCFGLPGIQGSLQDPSIDRRKRHMRDEPVGAANCLYYFQGDRWWNDNSFE